jgi:hypothetical protein
MNLWTDEITELAYCRELYRQFKESLFGTGPVPRTGDLRTYYSSLMADLIAFVEAAASTDERPCILTIKPNGEKDYLISRQAYRHFKRIPVFILIISLLSRRYIYSEHIEVFREACAALGLAPSTINDNNWHLMDFLHPAGMDGATTFNALHSFLRREWAAKGYKTRFQRRREESKKRSKDYQRYVDAWFAKLAKLIVLRIDLSYRPEYWETITLEDLNADYERLENNARHNKIFRGRRGHVAKIEYGLGKGLHMHVIFLFDTEHKQAIRHVYHAQQIGEYWKRVVTKGRGDYWNCNADTAKYQRWGKLGVGSLHVEEDHEKIRNLKLFVIDYLCKMDQFLRPTGTKSVQLIRRGNWPEPEPKKRGAPRKVRSASSVTKRNTNPDMVNATAVAETIGATETNAEQNRLDKAFLMQPWGVDSQSSNADLQHCRTGDLEVGDGQQAKRAAIPPPSIWKKASH